VVHSLTFPNHENFPAGSRQASQVIYVAFLVSHQLRPPITGVGLRHPPVLASHVLMPKAANREWRTRTITRNRSYSTAGQVAYPRLRKVDMEALRTTNQPRASKMRQISGYRLQLHSSRDDYDGVSRKSGGRYQAVLLVKSQPALARWLRRLRQRKFPSK